MSEHIIWSNSDISIADLADWFDEQYPDADDSERFRLAIEWNLSYLDDERENLDIELGSPILVIGDLGLWSGRAHGYKEIASGNIKDCLYDDADVITWYVDGHGDFRCKAVHHDGTNRYLYRVWKNGVSDAQKENLKEKIYSGSVKRSDITRLTNKIGPEIGKVYGW